MNSFISEFITYAEQLTQWHWFGLAVVLVILEVMLGANFVFLWLGVSAATVAVALMVYPELAWEYQFIVFSLESIACLAFWFLYLKHNPATSDKPRLNRRSEQYIGRVVTLKEPIVNGRGKISVDDSSWRVEGPDLPEGANVRVVDVNGVVLQVEKVD